MPVYIGEIRPFAGSFAPAGWYLCDGQILSIASNVDLWSLLGTRFGGDGVTTFALPDLRGRVPIGPGQGPFLTNRGNGETGGTETHLLTSSEMPSHSHAMRVTKGVGNSDDPTGRVPARNPAAVPHFHPTPDTDMAAGMLQSAGGDQAHNNMGPSLAVNYIIAKQGVYPPRP